MWYTKTIRLFISNGMKLRLTEYIDQLMTSSSGKTTLDTFFKCLFVLLFFLNLSWAFDMDYLYGSNSIFPNYPYERGSVLDLFLVLSNHGEWLIYFETAFLMLLVLCFFKNHWVWAALLYFVQLNFYYKGNMALNSGYMLLNICLFFNVIRTFFARSEQYRDLANNAVLLLLKWQVCLIYVVSFLYKIEGHGWTSGSALKELSGNQVFGGGIMGSLPDWMLVAGTFVVLIHQGVFSLAIWFKQSRIPAILVGVGIHLGIVIFMGLLDFGLIMVLMYLLFLSPQEMNRIGGLLKFWDKKKRLQT